MATVPKKYIATTIGTSRDESGGSLKFLFENLFKNHYDKIVFLLATFNTLYVIASFSGFFLNMVHLAVLTRKALRTNLVYTVMIGICLNDLIQCFCTICNLFMEWNIVYKVEDCEEKPYFHILTDILAETVQYMSRRCSSLLGLFIAGFRTISVLYPMSNVARLNIKTGYFIIFLISGLCAGWSAFYFSQIKIYKVDRCSNVRTYLDTPPTPSYMPYTLEKGKHVLTFQVLDGAMALLVDLLYIILVILLLVKLHMTARIRKNISSDKSTNTSKLLTLMACSFCCSETLYGSFFFADRFMLYGYNDRRFFEQAQSFVLTFQIFNSVAHCFICFFLSSQYRETVKTMIRIKTPPTVMVLESSVHPTTRETSKTSNLVI
ncbi:G_PROTEIN_RECEP_F1_2 domain-containing protein [Caenorhabditis elegans]|uniref:G_PROTEIN_RECEP_F1_2 domain-containing protein n=1 Tax=Caenorhabditis elegans TaxID=6239 RepID=O18277_CAEEL|nr:G_PROTEIN_RECEP_F1_2 domain-containing protein [Caenorhabditis elegans]CAB07720.2 G_PROTEIN_RECEP_F1_2 domain-containing protein [Caenorhabditis elegans]|eukprot:NP_499658.2 Serpentine Receptor, class W [Caenorhabditis elegans]